MKYGLNSLTGIRPTADLTIANYIGAIQPILEAEQNGQETCVFIAELHAATTHSPAEVLANARELGRTLLASGVTGDVYSQKDMASYVSSAELMLRGLTSVNRLLRLPTLKEKVKTSDDTGTANVALALYPIMMAADIVLMRPEKVPTGKDQLPHLEITKELIRSFNKTYRAELPEPAGVEVTPPNILSLDGSGRKMSKSLPKGAIFLDDPVDVARKKVMRTVTATEPGPAMNTAVDNLATIAQKLNTHNKDLSELFDLGKQVKDGAKKMGVFKSIVAEIVGDFLFELSERRQNVSDAEVSAKLADGGNKARGLASQTLAHMEKTYWSA